MNLSRDSSLKMGFACVNICQKKICHPRKKHALVKEEYDKVTLNLKMFNFIIVFLILLLLLLFHIESNNIIYYIKYTYVCVCVSAYEMNVLNMTKYMILFQITCAFTYTT